jgi:hypothetical protein
LVALGGEVARYIMIPTGCGNKESTKAAYSIKVLEGRFSGGKQVEGLFRPVGWLISELIKRYQLGSLIIWTCL